jgi:hypothetical protein
MPNNPLEEYLRKLSDVRRTGSGVAETSQYTALDNLLNAVGATLKPKVRSIPTASHGAGFPDFGLYTPDQFQKASAEKPLPGTKPSRGVVEAKPTSDEALLTADGEQYRNTGRRIGKSSSRISATSCWSVPMPKRNRSSSNTIASRQTRRLFGPPRHIRDKSQQSKAKRSLIS